jgi:hypothetical protein
MHVCIQILASYRSWLDTDIGFIQILAVGLPQAELAPQQMRARNEADSATADPEKFFTA